MNQLDNLINNVSTFSFAFLGWVAALATSAKSRTARLYKVFEIMVAAKPATQRDATRVLARALTAYAKTTNAYSLDFAIELLASKLFWVCRSTLKNEAGTSALAALCGDEDRELAVYFRDFDESTGSSPYRDTWHDATSGTTVRLEPEQRESDIPVCPITAGELREQFLMFHAALAAVYVLVKKDASDLPILSDSKTKRSTNDLDHALAWSDLLVAKFAEREQLGALDRLQLLLDDDTDA